MNEIGERLLHFYNNKKSQLIQVYISERQKHNELGALFNFIENNEMKSTFYPISSPHISDEAKNDIINKNNYRNSFAFFYITDVSTNTTILKIEDLDISN